MEEYKQGNDPNIFFLMKTKLNIQNEGESKPRLKAAIQRTLVRLNEGSLKLLLQIFCASVRYCCFKGFVTERAVEPDVKHQLTRQSPL